MKYNK